MNSNSSILEAYNVLLTSPYDLPSERRKHEQEQALRAERRARAARGRADRSAVRLERRAARLERRAARMPGASDLVAAAR